METNITKKSDTEVVIKGTIPAANVVKERDPALKTLGKGLKLDGFRPGKIPESVLLQHIDQSALWQEMANRVLNKVLPKVVEENELRVIGRPHISVTKLAPDNPLEFTAELSILPKVDLPDYVAIAQKLNVKKDKLDEEVSDKEIQEAVDNVRKRVAEAESKPQEGEDDSKKKPARSGDHSGGDVKLPELNDDFVKKLGPYTDVADFKAKLAEQLKTHKTHMAREKRRLNIIEEIIKEAKPKVPSLLVEAELDKMLAQMRADIQRAGMNIDEYMKQIKKTEEDFRKDWQSDAEKRAQIQLVLNEIAQSENIKADEQEVEEQAKQLLAQHPPTKGDLKQAEMATRIYVATQLANERVFDFLENQE